MAWCIRVTLKKGGSNRSTFDATNYFLVVTGTQCLKNTQKCLIFNFHFLDTVYWLINAHLLIDAQFLINAQLSINSQFLINTQFLDK